MGTKKISDLTAATAVAAADLLEIETAGGLSRKVTADVLTSYGDSLPLDRVIDAGEATMPRFGITSIALTMTSQTLRLAYFRARKTETITKVAAYVGGTAAGATPTLVRFGIYTVAGNGDLTLAASTANDTALLASTNAYSEKALSASFSKVRGEVYAVGLLVVTGATAPVIAGASSAAALTSIAPRLNGTISGQADLPSTVALASVGTTSGITPYFELRA